MEIQIDSSGFANNLATSENTLSKVLTKVDTLTDSTRQAKITSKAVTTSIDLDNNYHYAKTLTANTEFTPNITTAVRNNIFQMDLYLAGFSATFTGFELANTSPYTSLLTTDGSVNIIFFFRVSDKYYYVIFDQYVVSDTNPPVLTNISISDILDITATFNVTCNESATLYWGVYPSGGTTPSQADLIAGTGSVSFGNDAITATANIVAISGMSASTNYRLFYAAKDSFDNYSSIAYVDFTTEATVFFSSLVNITNTSGDLVKTGGVQDQPDAYGLSNYQLSDGHYISFQYNRQASGTPLAHYVAIYNGTAPSGYDDTSVQHYGFYGNENAHASMFKNGVYQSFQAGVTSSSYMKLAIESGNLNIYKSTDGINWTYQFTFGAVSGNYNFKLIAYGKAGCGKNYGYDS